MMPICRRRHPSVKRPKRFYLPWFHIDLGVEHEHPIAIDVLFRHSARREAFIEPFPDMTTIKITDSPDCSHRLGPRTPRGNPLSRLRLSPELIRAAKR
jgi:hypothetical protein